MSGRNEYPCEEDTAQQEFAADALQPTLRCGFQARLKLDVRRPTTSRTLRRLAAWEGRMQQMGKDAAIAEILKKFPDPRTHEAIRFHLGSMIDRLPNGLSELLVNRDGASQLPTWLRQCFHHAHICHDDNQHAWEQVGLWFMNLEHR